MYKLSLESIASPFNTSLFSTVKEKSISPVGNNLKIFPWFELMYKLLRLSNTMNLGEFFVSSNGLKTLYFIGYE